MRDFRDETCQRRASIAVTVLAMLIAFAAGGCSRASGDAASAATAGPPKHGGQLTVSIAKEPPIINPWLAPGAMAATWMLIDGMNDPLAMVDEQGRWQPIIASEIPTSSNGGIRVVNGTMVVTFGIRPEAAWSDGVPIRCEDVVFTWKVVIDQGNQLSNRLGFDRIERIECPTPTRVVVTMRGPYAMFMSRIMALPPLPAHELEGKDFNTYWNDRITVSSGPFVFDEWQRGVKVVLARNPHWWRAGSEQLPYVDRVIFRFAKDANTLKMQLRMTEADIAMLPPDTNLVEELKSMSGIGFSAPPGQLGELLEMQVGKAPLNDVRVRQALAYAIDREMIARVVLKGQVEPLQQPVVPIQDLNKDDAYARYKADPDKVKSLLASAGYELRDGLWEKGGKPLHLVYVVASGYPYRMRVSQLMQQQLRRQGIDMEIQLVTSEILYTQVAPKGNFDIGEWSEATGTEPAPEVLYACREIPRKPQWAGKNRMRYCSRPLDDLMLRASEEIDVRRRAALVRQVDAHLANDVPVLPLFRLPDTIAWGERVHGITPNAASYHTWDMERWWVS